MDNKPKIEFNPPRAEGTIELNGTIRHSVGLERRQIDFFEQKNGNDCGACMLLNMQDALGAKNNADYVTDVKNMREWLSQHNQMRRDYRDHGHGGSWLAVGDLQQYINDQLGLQQKLIKGSRQVSSQPVQQNINIYGKNSKINFMPYISPDELAQDERNKFIWGVYNGTRNEHGGGNHYTGYLQTTNGIYLFDSMGHQSFQIKTQADLDDFVQHTVGDVNVTYASSPKIQIQQNTGNRTEISRPTQQIANTEQSTGKIEINNRTDNRARRMANAIKNIFR